MGILLNIVAFGAALWLLHFGVTRAWSNGHQHILKRRLLDKAILPESERSGLNMERALIPLVAFGPILLTLVVLWFLPGALAWATRSWGVWSAIVLAVVELAMFARSSELKDAALVVVYDENLPKFRKNLSSWQEKELGPFRAAWGKHLAANLDAAVDSAEGGTEDDDDLGAGEADEDGHGAGDPDRPPAHLEFEILEAHKDKSVIDSPPYFAPAGAWTVVKGRTRTEPAATFWFAETSPPLSGEQPFAFGEARIWTESEDEWRDLCGAIVAAFRPGTGAYACGTPAGPINFGTAVLSRSAAPIEGGGFGGTGTWTATKWFTEDGSEFFLNWSVKSHLGHFSEKDEGYADGVCEAFGAHFPPT